MTTRVILSLGLVLGLLALARASHANELETTISVTLEYDDNILRRSDTEIGDLKRTPSIDIDYKYDFASLNAVLGYSLKRVDYREDSFAARTDFTGQGNIVWAIIENRFSWEIDHNRNRIRIDNQEVSTPANEDDRTVVRTGPRIKLISGSRSDLSLQAYYLESRADASLDTEVINVGLNYIQRITDNFSLGLVAQSSEITTEVALQGYDNERIGLSLSRTSQNLNLALELGRNKVSRETGDENSGPYYSAAFSWLTTNSEFVLRANRELTDSNLGLSLNKNVNDGLNNGDGNLGNQDVIDRLHHEMGYTRNFQKAKISLLFTYDEQDFQILEQDENSEIVNLSFNYELSRRISLNYAYIREKNEFAESTGLKGEFVEDRHSVTVRYQINDALSLQFVLEDEEREYDKLILRNYDSASALMTISYRL